MTVLESVLLLNRAGSLLLDLAQIITEIKRRGHKTLLLELPGAPSALLY